MSNFSLLINGHEYKNFLSRDTLATKITWPLNAPQKFEFGLADADIEHLFGGNGVPDIDSPIVLTTDGFGASTFKGFLSASPEFVLAGYKPTAPVYKYRCRATDQSYELNQMSARLAVLPDLSGRRSDEIIRIITEFLLPGKFTYDLSAGQYQPDFKIESTDLWSDVLKKLAEHDQFHWWVLADTIYYKQLGDSTLGASCDITTNPVITGWNLDKLSVNPRDNPIKNDIIVVGDTAPKGRGKLFAIGSGFEGNFPIQTPIWGFEDEIIANTDWKSQPDASTWEVSDPTSQLVTDAENLQFQGGAGIEQTYVRLLRAIELSGSLRLFHGEIQTTTPCDGVVGGLYKSFSSLALSNQLFGFLLSPNSGQTNISAAVRGSAVGTPVTTQNNHTYVLITRIYANQAFSHLTVYKSRNTGATYGGNNVLKSVHVTFEVWDYKIEAAAKLDPTVIRVWDQELDVSDLTSPFLAYAVLQLGTGADNHIAVSFTELAKPIQVILKTAKPVLTGYSSGDFTKYRAHGAVGSGTASITFVVEPGYNSVVGTINSTETVEIDTAGGTQLDVAVSGSWTGEVYFEVSSDGTNWSPYSPVSVKSNESFSVQLPAIGSGGLPSDWQERTEYPVGFGIDRARATVGSDRQGHVLQFYGDQPENLPAACEKVELSFNCAGRAMGRVRDAASVATLAAKFGAPNDGVRTKIVTDFSPTIRRDEDAYNAAAALLDDSTSMQYDGTYVGLLDTFCTKRPMPGRHIYVNEPRVSAQNFLVSQVEQLIFGDAAALVDRSEFSLTFGTVLDADMFAAKLRAMEGMKIQGAETEVLKPVDLQNIAISYLVDSVEDWTVEVLPNYDNSSLNFRLTIMSPLPAGCGVEIRKWDRGWGQYSDATKDYGLVARGEIGQRVFVLPRKSRKQIFYMRLFKEQS